MATHSAKLRVPGVAIDSRDVEISVKRNGKQFGTLKVSKGSLDWREASDQKSHVIGWTAFAEFAKEQGRKHKR